ncbi:MAG: hypothetical protein JXR48_11990 [Candidatus Delongbacteria bacterium]|nr:hypothetical protein [Candidatus Delongbacteria bacterium]MBN2835673.1 hypothetical protein [Candidatus Delongbacteria bacterium]
MDREVFNRITKAGEEIIEKYNQELIEVEIGNNRNGVIVKLCVGSKSGVDVQTLANITRDFNKMAELKGESFLPFDFQLEVSSPGLDRPLKNWKDFYRNEGREVRITILNEDNTTKTDEYTIVSASNDEVLLKNSKEELKLNFDTLKKAKLVIKF